MNETPQNLREYLNAERSRGFTDAEIAKRLDISPAFLSQLKNGRRRAGPRKARAIANRTGVPVESLLREVM